MSAYDNDDRVHAHPDGTTMVFSDDGHEYNVAPLRDPGTWQAIPGLFGGFDADGGRLDVPEGDFDDVVYAIIGEPR
jgi:hypothetical protein